MTQLTLRAVSVPAASPNLPFCTFEIANNHRNEFDAIKALAAVARLLGASVTAYWIILLSRSVVLSLAWLSWHLVEKPVLALKRRAGDARALSDRSKSALTVPAAFPVPKLWRDGRPAVSKP